MECRTGGMQDWRVHECRNAGKEGCKKGGMQESRGAGKYGCRDEGCKFGSETALIKKDDNFNW